MTCAEVFVLVFGDCCCSNRRPEPSLKGIVDAAEGRRFEGTWSPGRTIDVVLIAAQLAMYIDCA